MELEAMNAGGDLGVFDAANLQELVLGSLTRRGSPRLADHGINLPAAQEPAPLIPQHTRLKRDIAGIGQGDVAQKFVRNALGENDDVSRSAACFSQAHHAGNKGQHHHQQEDDEREGQRREEGTLPTHGQVAQLVS